MTQDTDRYVRLFIDILTAVIVVIILGIVLLMFFGRPAKAGECLGSARAVWSAHPGAWATWHNVDGDKCWMVGKRHAKEVVRHEQRVRSRTARLPADETRPRPLPSTPAGAIPLPRPDPRMERWVGEMEQPDVVDEVVRALRMIRFDDLMAAPPEPPPQPPPSRKQMVGAGRWRGAP